MSLKDIVDLDFLLGLDDNAKAGESEAIAARDRDIFQQISKPELDDTRLMAAWLDYRRLLFFHEAGKDSEPRLPGSLFDSLYRWAVRIIIFISLFAGWLTSYSFLAYHGSRPVNVTLFVAFFILLQIVLFLVAAMVALRRLRLEASGRGHIGYSLIQGLSFRVFVAKFYTLFQKLSKLPEGHFLSSAHADGRLARLDTREYRSLLFWPFFMLSSLAALGFSSGALGGTLFRVMVTDLAFGWQSTLFNSGAQIHSLVSWMALPWSWAMPDTFAVPSLAQIEGSRILLKEGIQGLATENLVAWWPFLCMGILTYGIFPRLGLLIWAGSLQKKTLARFDFTRPRYQRLVIRMRTPQMDTDIKETGGTRAEIRDPLPRPGNEDDQDEKTISLTVDATKPALVLCSSRGYPDKEMEKICEGLERQLGLTISDVGLIMFDFKQDESSLSDLAKVYGNGPVVILQEVWQPPIRGLLHYFVQVKKEVFSNSPIWIIVTRTPGEDTMVVDSQDINYQVWKTAVSQLNDPDIVLERWM